MQTATEHTAFSWNYISVGMDAKAAYGFHELRESKPKLAASRASNQFWYGYFSCASGWFCGSGPLNNKVRRCVTALLPSVSWVSSGLWSCGSECCVLLTRGSKMELGIKQSVESVLVRLPRAAGSGPLTKKMRRGIVDCCRPLLCLLCY